MSNAGDWAMQKDCWPVLWKEKREFFSLYQVMQL